MKIGKGVLITEEAQSSFREQMLTHANPKDIQLTRTNIVSPSRGSSLLFFSDNKRSDQSSINPSRLTLNYTKHTTIFSIQTVYLRLYDKRVMIFLYSSRVFFQTAAVSGRFFYIQTLIHEVKFETRRHHVFIMYFFTVQTKRSPALIPFSKTGRC